MPARHSSLVLASTVAALLLAALVTAEVGECRFDADRCSCKVGDANQGVCWDPVSGTPGRCRRRFCNRGWTCACGGRTHVCYRSDRQALRVNEADENAQEADCTATAIQVSSSREISLGNVSIGISPKGAEANNCREIAWWHNGVLMGNYKPTTGTVNAADELASRNDHTLLELRGGDVLAWRYRAGSYFCQRRQVEMTVNGTTADLNTPGVEIFYARAFTTDWFEPKFSPVFGLNEDDPDLQKFLPLRTAKLVGGAPVSEAGDYFEPLNSADEDHKPSNFYFRLTLPYNLTTTFANNPIIRSEGEEGSPDF